MYVADRLPAEGIMFRNAISYETFFISQQKFIENVK